MNRVTDPPRPSSVRRGNGRRPLRRLTATGLAFGAALALVAGGVRLVGVDAAAAAVPSGYTWDNVQIVGGGFVPGIEFSEAEAGLSYLRTDIGGAYRMDAGATAWTPLLDGVGWDNWGWNGVVSLAPDPVDADRVYAAVGMYTNSWDPNNGAILRSSDRGNTWQASELPFKLGGNMPGRGMGERLAVDPNKNSVLYFGAPSGKGLWRSTDSGATWAQVANFPNTGNYIPIPGSEYGGDEVGVVWVTFDGSSASAGQATQDIYVGVADPQNTVYRSTDAGASWERLAGQPTGFMAHKGVLDTGTGDLYIATSDTGGPYDGSHGDVWKYATGTGEWTQISPVPSSDTDNNYYGYSGLTVDRQNPGTLMVSAYSSWWPDTIFFRSTDGGTTWSRIWDWAGYPSRTLHYSLDISTAPWLDWEANPSPPEVTPKLGWMTEAAAIDPFDPDHFLFGTGATVYGTHNLTAWDAGGTADFEVAAKGVEETAVLDLVSPPSGPQLVSALGDIGGFAHTDITQVPQKMFSGPVFTSTTSLDFAGTNPSVMVRSGTLDRDTHPNDSRVAFSTDGGNNWFGASSEPGGTNGGGTVAANADGTRFLWSSEAADVSLSVGFGSSWTSVSGLPRNSVVEADRVDPQRFYAFYSGGFYVSTDGGASFTKSAATGLPTTAKFQAVPGIAGDIWLAGGAANDTYGLWHSTDYGATFTKVSGVDEADVVGFGKAAPGASYPAIFTSARIGGVRGIYRSDDAGASWVRVNDDDHQYGVTNSAITGDMRVWGRVYVGTNGRGVVYGDPSGSTPTPTVTPTPTTTTTTSTPTVTPTPTTTTTTSTPTTTTTTATPTPTSGQTSCEVTYTVAGQWTGGFLGQVMVTNTGSTAINGWTLRWTFPDGQQIQSAWGGIAGTDGSATTLTNESWNATIAPGAAVYPGFIGSWSGSNGTPDSFSLNGSTCAVTP